MAAAAVFACVNVIASTIASLPVKITNKKTKECIEDHPLGRLLNQIANEEMTAADYREAYMVNTLLWGNGFSFTDYDGITPRALYPLRSVSTSPARFNGTGRLLYNTITGSAAYTFEQGQICHVKDVSYDGIVGLSRTRYASNPIGLALALEKFGAKFFSNGATLGGIVELPANMKAEQVEEFKRTWKANYTGPDNSLRTAMLTDGMKYTQTGTDPRNSQMIDAKVFQVREVARIYRVPLHMIADLEGATFSNIEQQSIEFVQNCLLPWTTKLEQEWHRKLLTEAEKETLEIKHDFDALQRADTTMRYAAYNTALQSGWMTRNEVRAKENMPPMEGGDKPLQPLNMGSPGGDPAKTGDKTQEPVVSAKENPAKAKADPEEAE